MKRLTPVVRNQIAPLSFIEKLDFEDVISESMGASIG
jgi:hypothetical protein